MNHQESRIWEKLLELYFYDPAMTSAWRVQVQQALIEEEYEQEKSAALEEIFYNFFVKNSDKRNVCSKREKMNQHLQK